MINYTKEFFLKIVDKREDLENEIKNTNGLILFKMEKENVLPKISTLMSLKMGITVPFIVKFYSLDEGQLNEIKSWISLNNRDIEITSPNNAFELDERFKRDITPQLAAELIIKRSKFDVKEYMSIGFLLETFDIIENEYQYQNIFDKTYMNFSIGCIENAIKQNECIYKNKHLMKINSILETLQELSYPEIKSLCASKEYSVEIINYWCKSATSLSLIEIPVKHMINVGVKSDFVLTAFREVFNRISLNNKYDFNTITFLTSIGYFDANESYCAFNNVSQFKEVFGNKVPFFWTVEDLNNPNVQETINDYLFNVDLGVNSKFFWAYEDNVFDLIFTEKRIHELALKYKVSISFNLAFNFNFLSDFNDVSRASYIFATILIFKRMTEIGLSPYENTIAFPTDILLKNIANIEYKPNTITAKYIDGFYRVLLNTPKLFNYEFCSILFDNSIFFPSVKEVMIGKTPLDAFFRDYLNDMTFDKFLHIEKMLTNEERVVILNNSFNPYDIELLKEISILNFDGVVGNPNAPKASSENCMLYRASTFKSTKLNILKITALSRCEELPYICNHFLENENMLLDGDSFFRELQNKKDPAWIDFAVKYQKKFPGFFTGKEEITAIINNIYGLSNRLGIKNDTDYSYENIKRILSSNIENDIELFWLNMSLEVKEKFIDDFIKSEDFVPNLLMNNITVDLFIKRLFIFSVNEFDRIIPDNKKVIGSLISIYIDNELGENHLNYLFSLCRRNKYLGYSSLRRVNKNVKNKTLTKNMIIHNYPEFIFECNSFNALELTNCEILKAIDNIIMLDVNILYNIFISSVIDEKINLNLSYVDKSYCCNKINEQSLSKRIFLVNIFKNILNVNTTDYFKDKIESFFGIKGLEFNSLLQLIPEIFDNNFLEKDKNLFNLLVSGFLYKISYHKFHSFFKVISFSISGDFENKIFNNLLSKTMNLYAMDLFKKNDYNNLLKLKSEFSCIKFKEHINLNENILNEFILFTNNMVSNLDNKMVLLNELSDILVDTVLNPLSSKKLIEEISYHVNAANFTEKYLDVKDMSESSKIILSNKNLLSALEIYNKTNVVKNAFILFDDISCSDDCEDSYKI